eukprot:scaffold12955_cov69-Isochrysis_galbana.AAC.1
MGRWAGCERGNGLGGIEDCRMGKGGKYTCFDVGKSCVCIEACKHRVSRGGLLWACLLSDMAAHTSGLPCWRHATNSSYAVMQRQYRSITSPPRAHSAVAVSPGGAARLSSSSARAASGGKPALGGNHKLGGMSASPVPAPSSMGGRSSRHRARCASGHRSDMVETMEPHAAIPGGEASAAAAAAAAVR